MNVSSLLGPPRLRAEDIPEEGITRTIKRVELQRSRYNPIVVFFEREKRGLALSQSGLENVARGYGAETDDWIGCRLHLFPAVVAGGDGQGVTYVRVETDEASAAEAA